MLRATQVPKHRLGTIRRGVIVEAMRMDENTKVDIGERRGAELELRMAGRLNKLLCAC